MFIRKRLAGSLGVILYCGLAIIPGFALIWLGGGIKGILPASITNALTSLGAYGLLAFGASLLISPWIVLDQSGRWRIHEELLCVGVACLSKCVVRDQVHCAPCAMDV
jgi:hypothetical protein